MSNPKTINIHGKEYTPVSERVKLWHEDNAGDIYLETKTRIEFGYVISEAVVKTKKGAFTGTSAVNLENSNTIEKENPFEVAETSAVGRALGFANYGITEAIASADEMGKAQTASALANAQKLREHRTAAPDQSTAVTCETCGALASIKTGTKQNGMGWEGIFCSTGDRSHTKFTDAIEESTLAKGKQAENPTAATTDVDPESVPF